MNIYFKVKSTITIMQIRSRVPPFMKNNNLWMNNKQIDDNRPMDAAIIFQGHYKYDNKHVIYKKVLKALNKVKLNDDATNEQKRVLKELQRQNHYGWTRINKRHTYTDGVHERISTKGLIIVVKKLFL